MRMIRWILAALALALYLAPAKAQTFVTNNCTLPVTWSIGSTGHPFAIDTHGATCINGSITASLSGFPTSQSTGTPIAATTGGVTGTLPTGAVVVATNVGTTNGAYCKLGASATTSDQFISPNGGWFAFTVGANTQLTCITSASTTTVNIVGGSGLPTGTGGGGGGGSGGAVTIASGAIASGAYAAGSLAAGAGVDGWDLTQGAKADSVCGTATGTCSMVALQKFIANAVNSAIPAGTANIGNVGQISQYPTGATAITASATGTTGATTATLAGTGGKTTFICGYSIRANATAAATVTDTITGTITGTLSSILWVAPLASGIGVDEMVFSPCIPASATNTGIAIVSGAPGSGGTVSSKGWGYQL